MPSPAQHHRENPNWFQPMPGYGMRPSHARLPTQGVHDLTVYAHVIRWSLLKGSEPVKWDDRKRKLSSLCLADDFWGLEVLMEWQSISIQSLDLQDALSLSWFLLQGPGFLLSSLISSLFSLQRKKNCLYSMPLLLGFCKSVFKTEYEVSTYWNWTNKWMCGQWWGPEFSLLEYKFTDKQWKGTRISHMIQNKSWRHWCDFMFSWI